ncbi:glucosaminidase domain-containing protein [Enterococcus faecalis]|uniref:glucosaminidase domain-containing protein n=1 Tax=Enterococcus faecalis TaxID=1351 RepID=UPI0027E13D1C|nr:glucosaminidase domain-containing protein [Enterococcus faecalis]MDQ6109964.1 glucosaminidase domain-containing protein [Enterococcus faecalis]MDQ6186836.1 glucosaminidase domain-containing protein [Enterococcus faecalis]MDQ6225934.1 glucosaminidase domain-containing protein [Enterococcus faecalis]
MKKTTIIKLALLSCGLVLCTQPINSNAEEAESIWKEHTGLEQSEISSYTPNMGTNNLNGYELPLFSEYEYTYQAAIVAEAINHLGETFFANESNDGSLKNSLFIEKIMKDIFQLQSEEILNERFLLTEEIELQYGDLLTWSNIIEEMKGVYIGQGKVLFLDNYSEETTEMNPIVKIDSLDTLITDETEINVQRIKEDTQLSEYGQELVDNYAVTTKISKNEQTSNFISEIAEEAKSLAQEHNMFASVMIAQAILESASGSSELSVSPYHNIFGIKGEYEGTSIELQTFEDNGLGEMVEELAVFRSYPTYNESLLDYVYLIENGLDADSDFYKNVKKDGARNYLEATNNLTGKYATDSKYYDKLNSIIYVYNLTQYDVESQNIEFNLEVAATRINEGSNLVVQSKESIPEEYKNLMTLPDYNGMDYNLSGSYPKGQCTWYVYNRMSQLGLTIDDYMGNGGDWGTTGSSLGYKILSKPQVGSAISFSPGTAGANETYGHVAFVEAQGENGILISEGNVVSEEVISYRVIPNEVAYSPAVSYIVGK